MIMIYCCDIRLRWKLCWDCILPWATCLGWKTTKRLLINSEHAPCPRFSFGFGLNVKKDVDKFGPVKREREGTPKQGPIAKLTAALDNPLGKASIGKSPPECCQGQGQREERKPWIY
ncbi:hypothetical protein X801_06632, partial [Opisthorchis viverrini]